MGATCSREAKQRRASAKRASGSEGPEAKRLRTQESVSFEVGEHVANETVAFGSMPIADFIAGCTAFSLPDTAKEVLGAYATLNCLRTMGAEDEEGNKTPTTQDVWESFCDEHGLPDGFKDAAAEHVVCDVDCPVSASPSHTARRSLSERSTTSSGGRRSRTGQAC